jgi:hypothetical protein
MTTDNHPKIPQDSNRTKQDVPDESKDLSQIPTPTDSKHFATARGANAQRILQLQRSIGNQAVQRLIAKGVIQRDTPFSATPTPPINLFPSAGQISSMLMERDRPILAWLDEHRVDIVVAPQGFSIVRRIRQDIPQAADIATNELMAMIGAWGQRNHIAIEIPQPTAGNSVSPSSLSSAATSGLSLRGTTQIGQQQGSITVSMSGLTLGLMNQAGTEGSQVSVTPGGVGVQGQGNGTTAGFNIGWNGSANFNVDHGSYHFNASVSQDTWQLSLTIGSTDMPDLAGISEVFRNGERALRNAVGRAATARNPNDIQTAVSDNLSAIKSAISTASNIQSVTAGQFRARFNLSGSTGGTGGAGSSSSSTPQPAGVAATISLEFVF